MKGRGFIVHCYADYRRDRLYIVGRLEDGMSFAAVESKWRPSLHIRECDKASAANALSSLSFTIGSSELKAFDSREKLLMLTFSRYRDYNTAGKILGQSGIISCDGDLKIPDAYLTGKYITGPVEMEGEARPGRLVDLVFPNPEIYSAPECKVSLKIASVDIETDVEVGTILAASVSFSPDGAGDSSSGLVRVLGDGTRPGIKSALLDRIYFHNTEASLLAAFLEDIQKADPDIITGWNVLDFDFPRLAERCACNNIPFALGRSGDESKFFPSYREDSADSDDREKAGSNVSGRLRSASALVPGRQVLDALRIFRSGGRTGGRYMDTSGYTLEAVARTVLGEGKLAASSGGDKIKELKALYDRDPVRFGEYCLRDSELVIRIMEKTGMFRLTVERACLTGVSLDKAWTSVVSFEHIYGMELRRRLIAPAPIDVRRSVSGAAGGTVLDPLPGLFGNVAVFDFRSLYPTIMLTFNIDPRAFAEAKGSSGSGPAAPESGQGTKLIVAPNGAAFTEERGILPELIASYFAARRKALEAGDEEASYVYKILMNSFYGVLGTSSCRYGRTELAGAITSFARKWLLFSRDWFTQAGYRVLYGDTDSLFVETGMGDETSHDCFLEWGGGCAKELNAVLKKTVGDEYGLESHMELRFEKTYRRFMIPHLRNNAGENRGRAKGYCGYLLDRDGGLSVEVKGMEAVRSDYTALARRVQLELLELVFSGYNSELFFGCVNTVLNELRRGKLDGELVYHKRLSRIPDAYTASTPPQVKAARALGWKDRRGTVEYVWTVNGPEPSANENKLSLPHSPLDYDHYAETQVLATARSIAAAAGWNSSLLASPGKDYFKDGQMELELNKP